MRKNTFFLVLGAALVLAACGGGGGDEPEKARVPLASTNYDAVATDVVSSIGGTGPVFSAFDGLATTSSSLAASSPSPYAALGTGQLGPVAVWALRQLGTGSTGLESSQAVQTETQNCVSGTVTATAEDIDNSNEVSSGDKITLVASQCVFEAGQPAVNGTLALRLNTIQLNALGEVLSASIGMEFIGFSMADLTLNGSASVSADSAQVTLAYRDLNARLGSQSLVYNHTLQFRGNTLVVNGNLTLNGSVYGLFTPEGITMGAAYPTGGYLKITDGHGAYVVSALSGPGYQHALYLAGDSVVDATSPLHTWSPL